jgi:hypothetical protein
VSFGIDVNDQDKLTTITITGPVDLRASVRAVGDLVRRPTFNFQHDLVVDMREMSESPVSVGELRVLAWTLNQEGAIGDRKVALILPEGPGEPLRGHVKQLNEFGGFKMAAFPDMAEAVVWLRAA